ncbi:MAG TPA: hypothetical protein VGG97_22315 [Bryobacteraceae bacterium]|jgi:hypothetical protein
MIQQSPPNRPGSIAKIKEELIGRGNEFVAKQRLDAARRAVISDTVPNDPLGGEDIRVLGVDGYADGLLTLRLSAAAPSAWNLAMQNARFPFSSIVGDSEPRTVSFNGDRARLNAKATTAEQTARYLKDWVTQTNLAYREDLQRKAAEERRKEVERIRWKIQKAEEEARVAEALRTIKF